MKDSTIVTVAKNTFRETVRDKILLSAVFVIIAIILFSLFIASISLEQSTRMILDFGITAIYALQIFVAVFIGSMLMYREIERKTFYLLLPKPVTRTEIIIGKCLGLAGTIVVVTTLTTLALAALLYVESGSTYLLPLSVSVFLSTLESIILILISILFSGITSPILAAISTVSFFFIGHAGEIFRKIYMTTDSIVVELLTRGVYYFLPNLEKFNIRNDIIYGTLPSPTLIVLSTVYGLVYAALLLLVTKIFFTRKDF